MPIRFILSERFKLNNEDVKSILKGAAIAGAGAFATVLIQGLSGLDFGEYTVVVVAFLSVLLNVVRKYLGEDVYAVKK